MSNTPKWQLRELAAVDLHKAGWADDDIAKLLGWKLSTVQRHVYPPAPDPRAVAFDRAWRLGLELSVRAARAVEVSGAQTLDELEATLPEIEAKKGFGRKTLAELRAEIPLARQRQGQKNV